MIEIRVSTLTGTDVVPVCLWPSLPAASQAACPPGLPTEVRCVDQATATVIEDLAREQGGYGRHHSAALVFHALFERALRQQSGP